MSVNSRASFRVPYHCLTSAPRFLSFAIAAMFGLLLGATSDLRTVRGADVAVPEDERLRVHGIAGTLVLSGAERPDATTLETFVALAGRRNARILYLVIDDRPTPADADLPADAAQTRATLLDRWLAVGGQQWLVARQTAGGPVTEELLAALASATGVWCDGTSVDGLRAWLADERVAAALTRIRANGGIVGGSARLVRATLSNSAAVAANIPADKQNDSANGAALSWLPGLTVEIAALDQPSPTLSRQLADTPLIVGLQIEPTTTLIVREREIRSIAAGDAAVHFATRAGRFDPGHRLSTRNRVADITALRRAAVDLQRDAYPPKEVPKPVVEKGTLVIVGGGGTPQGLMERFVTLAGGKEASIVVLPISMPDPLPPRDGAAEAFRRLGAKEVHVLNGRTPSEVNQPDVLEKLDRATGVWFGGGRQWRFVDAYESTPALEKLRGVLARDGVIGGSSAGATIQGDYLVRGHPLGPHIMMAEGYERSFAFLRGVGIDQHFTQRRRQPDMLSFMERYPQFLGIGLDETTAIVVRGSTAEVVGKFQAHFFDAREPQPDGKPRVVSLGEGAKFDLAERKTIAP